MHTHAYTHIRMHTRTQKNKQTDKENLKKFGLCSLWRRSLNTFKEPEDIEVTSYMSSMVNMVTVIGTEEFVLH